MDYSLLCIPTPFLSTKVTQQMLRYFKNDEKQNGPQTLVKVTKPTLKVENATTQSAQSSITVGSDPVENATTLTRREQKPHPIKYDQKARDEGNQVMLKATSEHEERKKVPQGPINVMKPTLELESAASQSAQGGIMVGSDLEKGARLCMYDQKGKSNQIKVKGSLEHQLSDCSGISGVVDLESVDPGSNMVCVDDELGKIDVDRLKGAFERTKRVKCSKNNVVGLVESELDSNFLIECELEKGVELEYAAAVKRQKNDV